MNLQSAQLLSHTLVFQLSSTLGRCEFWFLMRQYRIYLPVVSEIIVSWENPQGLKRQNLGAPGFRKKFIDSGRWNEHCVLDWRHPTKRNLQFGLSPHLKLLMWEKYAFSADSSFLGQKPARINVRKALRRSWNDCASFVTTITQNTTAGI